MLPKTQRSVAALHVAVDGDLVPSLRMSDVANAKIEIFRPKERHRVKVPRFAEHVAGGNLAVALGYHPMLDPDALAAVRVGPRRDVAGGVDVGCAGSQLGVDDHAILDGKPGLFRKIDAWRYADPDKNQTGIEPRAIVHDDLARTDLGEFAAEMKRRSVLPMDRENEVRQLRAQHFGHRLPFRRDD